MDLSTVWQWMLAPFRTPGPTARRTSRYSRLLGVERLEYRVVPANIFVTGNVTNSTVSADPGRFLDGAVASLTAFNGSFLAQNLRSAVAGSKALGGSNTIFLDTGTYSLANGEMAVNYGPATALTIKNREGTLSTIDANNTSRIFQVFGGGTTTLDHLNLVEAIAPTSGGAVLVNAGGKLKVTGCTFSDSSAFDGSGGAIRNDSSNGLSVVDSTFTGNTASGDGGAIFNNLGPLTITNCIFTNQILSDGDGGAIFHKGGTIMVSGSTFTNNQAAGPLGDGGAIFNSGMTLTVTSCTFTTNVAPRDGGAICQTGASSLSVTTSTFAGNTASNNGGAIYNGATTLTITACTLNDNESSGSDGGGGAVFHNGTTMTVRNSTFASNKANDGNGGAIFQNGSGTLTITNATFAGNHCDISGGAISQSIGAVSLQNTLVANNTADESGDDLDGTFTARFSLIGTSGGSSGYDLTGSSSNNIFGTASLDLGALDDNGGPTKTMAIDNTSTAYNKGSNALASGLTTDQRGGKRVQFGTVDIGAFEVQDAAKLEFLQQPTSTVAGNNINPAVTVRVLDVFGNLVTSTASISITANGPRGFAAGSVTTVNAVAGIATFDKLKLTRAGSYTLTARSNGLTSAVSSAFLVTAGEAAKLVGPATISFIIGRTSTGALRVQLQDAFGNGIAGSLVTFTAPITTTGPTGSFPGPNNTATALTDANGFATAPAFTPNNFTGSYPISVTFGTLQLDILATNRRLVINPFCTTIRP